MSSPQTWDLALYPQISLSPYTEASARINLAVYLLTGMNFHLQVRETDIEALERCVGAVAFGDLEAEDSRNLTEVNFMRIFRLGQLTAEYLLHVQDRLAYDNILLKVAFCSQLELVSFTSSHSSWLGSCLISVLMIVKGCGVPWSQIFAINPERKTVLELATIETSLIPAFHPGGLVLSTELSNAVKLNAASHRFGELLHSLTRLLPTWKSVYSLTSYT